jgi:hypothetical protein
MLLIMERGRRLLCRHQDQEWLAEVAGNMLKGVGVVGVNDQEKGFPGEGVQVPRIQAVHVFELRWHRPLSPVTFSCAAVRNDPTEIISICGREEREKREKWQSVSCESHIM